MFYDEFLKLLNLEVVNEIRGYKNDPDAEGKPLWRVHKATVKSENCMGDVEYKTLADGTNHVVYVSLFFHGI